MPKFLRSRQVEELWTRGQDQLAEGAFEEVLTIAREMERNQDPASYALSAQAYLGLGQRADAIAVLEHGVSVEPEAGLVWELLGTCYAEEGRLDDATRAYGRALGCESVWRDSVRVNEAALAQLRGDPQAALRILDAIEAPELQLKKVGIKALAQLDSGRAEAALETCRGAEWPESPTAAQKEHFAKICVIQVQVMRKLESPPEAIRAHLRRALTAIPDSSAVLTCYRQFQNRTSPTTKLFSVVADFELDPKSRHELRAVGFLRSGQAIADSPEEAIFFFRELEDDRLLVFAEVPDVCELSQLAEPLKGVTVRTPRIYYESRD